MGQKNVKSPHNLLQLKRLTISPITKMSELRIVNWPLKILQIRQSQNRTILDDKGN